MKKLVWVFGILLALSFALPNDLSVLIPRPKPTPVTPDVVPNAGTDAAIVAALKTATPEDKARVVDVYTGLGGVLRRDKANGFVATTEQFAKLHERTLITAIDTPGKYEGLDVAIEAVFAAAVGTDDVVSVTPELREKLISASAVVANSAK